MTPQNLSSLRFPPNAFRFGGGGGTGAGSPAAAIASAPTPVAAAPVTASAAEVVQASQDLRRQSLRKRGFGTTIYAGDTGGWNQNSVASPTNPKQGAGAAASSGSKTLGG